jgi:hypothetical protein
MLAFSVRGPNALDSYDGSAEVIRAVTADLLHSPELFYSWAVHFPFDDLREHESLIILWDGA